MARKYDLISELYNRTCKTVVSNPQNWQAFLRSACRNYKLRFDEQLLVYAQRPNATAVLEIERWNGTFGRWVNKGATGIAVFDDVSRSRQRLIHYFDISDTHESRYSRPVPIWAMKPEYESEIIETLESTFGALQHKEDLASAVLSAAENATEDNLPDYIRDLMYSARDSFLEDLDEDNISHIYRKTVANSVAYMLMIKTLSNLLKQDKEKFVVPRGVQDVIPIKAIYDDGIFLVGKDKFTKSFKFTDINYAVASREDKEGMILGYSELLNSFDSGATTKITVNNRNLNRTDFERNYKMGYAGDFLDVYREEKNVVMLENATGANAIVQDKYPLQHRFRHKS